MTKPKLHLSLFNHGVGARSLQDMRHFLLDGLQGLGYDVTWGERLETGRLNILWEYFSEDFSRRLLDSNVEYAIIATEVPHKRPESGALLLNNRSDLDWPLRSSQLPKVLEKAQFVWSLDPRPESLAVWREYAPTSYLGVGYSPSLHAAMKEVDIEPDLDFAFTGVPTDYRVSILNELRKKTALGYQPGLLTFEQRNIMLRRAKCNLALRLDKDWPLPSYTRIMSLLHAERLAISDVTPWCSAPADLVPQIEPEALARDPYGVLSAPFPHTPSEALQQLADTRPAVRVVAEAWEGLTR
jgi:hypothetical protein